MNPNPIKDRLLDQLEPDRDKLAHYRAEVDAMLEQQERSLAWQKWISCSYGMAGAGEASPTAEATEAGRASISLAASPNTPTVREMFFTAARRDRRTRLKACP